MIVRVHVELPANGTWEINLPKCPQGDGSEEMLKEWVWKHGKEQLLSNLTFTTEPNNNPAEDDDDNDTEEGEKKEFREQEANSQLPTPQSDNNICASDGDQQQKQQHQFLKQRFKQNICSSIEIGV